MNRNPAIYVAAAVCLCAASSASAHHSHGLFYDQCTSVTADGTIEGIQWKNPHILIDLKASDGTAYRAEWTSLQGLTNSGIAGAAEQALRVGDRVVVTGNPMRDRAQISASFPDLKFNEPVPKATVVDLSQIRRASDGWDWTRAPDSTPPKCAQK